MMLALTVIIVFVLLLINEIWWRKGHTHGEFSRKFVHITVGSFVAFWPFLLDWNEIKLLSLAFVAGVLLSKQIHLFTAIHSVQRPTRGELFFALAVGATALITQDKWIYMAALLQMSLADGLAAIIGTRYGNGNRYTVLGQAKSVYGTLTFFIASVVILVAFTNLSGQQLSPGFIVGLAVGASLFENIGVEGVDNLLVPVLVASMLTLA